MSVPIATACLSAHTFNCEFQTEFNETALEETGGGMGLFKPSSARPSPSGETACGVLWVGPGDLLLLEGLLQLWLFKSYRLCISVMDVTVGRDFYHPRITAQEPLAGLVPLIPDLRFRWRTSSCDRNHRLIPACFLHSFLSEPIAIISFGRPIHHGLCNH